MRNSIGSLQTTAEIDSLVGRLVVRGHSWSSGTVKIYLLDRDDQPVETYYADYKSYVNDDGVDVRAALFPHLPHGNYLVCKPGATRTGHYVTVFPADEVAVDLTESPLSEPVHEGDTNI